MSPRLNTVNEPLAYGVCILAAMSVSLSVAHAGPVCTPTWNVDPGVPGIASGSVTSMHQYDDGNSILLYAAGSFGAATGIPNTENIAAWNGSAWEAVGGGLHGGQYANCLEVFNGELYVGGYFNDAGGVAGTEKLAKWDGTAWHSVGAQMSSFLSSIWALQTWDDGNGEALYVAGNYVDAGGNVGFNHITKFDGTNFTQLGGGTIGGAGIPLIAISLAVWDDGNGEALYVGGRFSEVAGVPANRIAKWDGTQWSALGSGLAGGVATAPYDMVAFEGSLYVGGQQIDSAGGVPVTDVARWDGTQWHAVGDSLDGTVWDLAVFDDGSGPALYAIGLFTQSGSGTPIHYVAKLEGGVWVDAGSGIDDNCYSALVVNNGSAESLWVGGRFLSAAAVACNRVVRLDGCPIETACPADITDASAGGPDGSVNVFDLLALLENWGTNGLGADIAEDTSVVDVFDLLALLKAWGDC